MTTAPSSVTRVVARSLVLLSCLGALAVSARLTIPVPGTSVPQSAQTLAVLLVGAWLGARWGALALALYLAVGAAGLPVFSDGGAGWAHLVGPTGGFLVGFLIAAALVGTARDRDILRRFPPGVLVMLGAHAVILALGWGWLARAVGATAAFHEGVAPFILGGVAKSVLAAGLVWVVLRLTPGTVDA